MQCLMCFNTDVPDDAVKCPNCGEDPSGPINVRMTADHARRIDELHARGDVSALRDFARTVRNPAASKDANHCADALYEKQHPFTYPCSGCGFSTREREKLVTHLKDVHAFLTANAEAEANSHEGKRKS